jgi:hypothetical protein
MRRLSRLVLAATFAGLAAAVPAQAAEQTAAPDCVKEPCYQCFMYPCGLDQWLEYLGAGGGGLVTVQYNPPVVCVTEPCDQPMPVVVCVARDAVCTPR